LYGAAQQVQISNVSPQLNIFNLFYTVFQSKWFTSPKNLMQKRQYWINIIWKFKKGSTNWLTTWLLIFCQLSMIPFPSLMEYFLFDFNISYQHRFITSVWQHLNIILTDCAVWHINRKIISSRIFFSAKNTSCEFGCCVWFSGNWKSEKIL